MFTPKQQMVVDADAKGGAILIRCPVWANEVVAKIPSRRWQKAARAWRVPVLRQNMDAIAEIIRMGGVTVTDAARNLMLKYTAHVEGMGTRGGAAFPSWYKFKTDPRKHQQRALAKGYGLRAFALFMDMQTGKTKTSIDLCAAHRMEGHIEAVLVFTKNTLRKNWLKQYDQHCPLPYVSYLPKTSKSSQFARWLSHKHDYKIMIVGWESLSQGKMIELVRQFVRTHKCAVVGDETTFITGHDALRAKLAVEVALQCEYKYALAGRPAMEGPLNLFMPFEFLDTQIVGLGDWYAFRNRYAVMGGYMHELPNGKKIPTKVTGYQHLDELAGLIAPHIFEIMKDEAYDLPPKRYKSYDVEITSYQREVYKKVKTEGLLELRGGEQRILTNTLEVMLRLHQITGGYAVKGREVVRTKKTGEVVTEMKYDSVELIPPKDNPKMIEVCNVMEEIRGRHQSLVWAVYMPEILALKGLFLKMGLKVAELHGGIKGEDERQDMVDRFNAGHYDVMVGNASTGGMGYTLQAATMNMFYNNTAKAIDRVQAEDRSYGDGQTKSGMWADIIAGGTVDVTFIKALEMKMDVSEYVRHRIKDAIKLLDGEVE